MDSTITSEQSLGVAIRVINDSDAKVAIVLDAERKVVGVITDGDVRRALLAGGDFETPAFKIMSSKPRVFDESVGRDELLSLARRDCLRHFPIVDASGRLLRVETLETLMASDLRTEPVMILAGGRGSRLMPLTEDCPKPMLPVGDKPMMEHTLEDLKRAGFREFYISVNYLADQIVNYFGDGSRHGVSISYVSEETPLGTAGPLSLLPERVGDQSVIVVNGDILTKMDFANLADFHSSRGAAATMCVRGHNLQVPFGVVQIEEGDVQSIVEKPTYTMQVNAGIYVIGASARRLMEPGRRLDMPTLLERAIAEDLRVAVFPIHEEWADVGRHEDLSAARTRFAPSSRRSHELGLLKRSKAAS